MPVLNKRLIQAEDLYRLELASNPRISPNGQSIIYSQSRIDRKTEKKYANLWVVPTNSPNPQQFTFGEQTDASPRWSPDGTYVAFLSNRADKEKPAQLYLIPFHGGEAHPLTSIPGTIGAFSWSPDGKRLVCQVRKTDEDVLDREKDEQKKKLGVVDRHYTRLFYKLDGFGYLPKERWHLWIVDANTGKSRQLTDHPIFDEQSPAWSPDGKSIVFVSNRSQDPDSTPDRSDIYLISSKGGEISTLSAPIGSKSHPSFSPDGKWLAYYGSEGEGLSYKNSSLWVIPLDGSAPARNLTEVYDVHVSAWTINDLGEPETMPAIWALDGQSLYFPVTIHGSSVLMSIRLDGSDLKEIVGRGGVIGSPTFDVTQNHLAFFYGSMTDPGQICLLNLNDGAPKPLTRLNHNLLAELDLGQVNEVWYKGPDGNDLQGWILTPPGFDPHKKYPSILEIHGGPLTQYGSYFMHEFYYFASKGYVVHFTNPRGGRGYGEAHAKAIHADWGNADYADLMAWTDRVAQEPYIDVNRMGVTGGSYGGYMTVWIIGHTQRFKAAVTQRCVSNFVSMWGSSDFNWTFQHVLNDTMPFEDLNFYWDHSPIKYIGNAKTPTKVIHNEMDHRCPIEQGEQVFVALKRLGVDTEFVRFPDEFHGLSRTGRTDRRISRLNHILSWFQKYIQP